MYNKEVGMTLDEAVTQYKGMILKLAHSFRVWGWDYEDNVQNLWVEFIQSYKQFKNDRNAQFMTYAYQYLQWKIATWTTRKRMMPDELDKVIVERDAGKLPVNMIDTIVSDDLVFHYPEMWVQLDKLPNGWVSKAWSAGWTFEELGTMLDVSHQWVYELHKRNMEVLKKLYAKI